MKKIVCLLVAAAMLLPINTFQKSKSISAEDVTTTTTTSGSLRADIVFHQPIKKTKQGISASIHVGDEVVSVNLGGEDTTFEGIIQNQKVTGYTRVTTDQDDIRRISIVFDGLPLNTYHFQLKGNGFHTVEQDVEIKDYSKYLYIDTSSVFLCGDLNDDGMVNDMDYNLELDQIDQDSTDLTYDINGDGIVDILDLSYIHKTLSMKAEDALESLGNAILKPENITIETTPEVTLQGTVENLINPENEEPLTFGFKDETQTISKDTPIEIPLALTTPVKMNKIEIDAGEGESAITSGTADVTIIDEQSGAEIVIEKPFGMKQYRSARAQDSNIVIDLGGQVAVKHIKIKVTGTRTNRHLAEITKVEFLNDVYDTIPVPEAAYPKNVSVTSKDSSLDVAWDNVVNVNGYQVKYVGYDSKTKDIAEKIVNVTDNHTTLSNLTNFMSYTISVQSITDDGWSSGYGESVIGMPKPTSVPETVENVNVKGGYRNITVSWGKSENALTYNVYYRIKGSEDYKKISGIKDKTIKIDDLADATTYQVCVSGSNDLGEGGKSAVSIGTTTNLAPTITPNYHLINFSLGEDKTTAGIKDVTYPSANPEGYDKFDIVDNDQTSYWQFNSWDAGGYNKGKPSPIVTFKEAHTFGEFVVIPSYNFVGDLTYVKVQYWDENGKGILVNDAQIQKCYDTNKNLYYRIKLKTPITSDKIQINLAQYWSGNNDIKISELKYYTYDTLAEDIQNLFGDDLQITLKENVTQKTINDLSERLEIKDQGELHPDYVSLKKDLDYAQQILQDKDLSKEITTVDQKMSTKNDVGKGFSYNISDLQPLGIAARAGDQIAVYLGKSKNATGNVQLVMTQPYATPNKWSVVSTLQPGKNDITIPDITSKDIEHGGSLYLRYVGKEPGYDMEKNPIRVRVSGGIKIPYLKLDGIHKESEMKALISDYIDDLNNYVSYLDKEYKDSAYSAAHQALNVTEIASDQMLFSIPATQALSGIKNGTATKAEWIENLYQNELAAEQLMDLTYAQKGFSDNAKDAVDKKPHTRINIRYMDVQNAFMYAGGGHVGIPFGSGAGLMKGKPAKCPVDKNEKCSTGALYGWGIAHEIGHELDQQSGAYAEVSNNVVAQFAMTLDEERFSRIGGYKDDYTNIYQKVTSGSKGYASSVFTTLGMYWQLHLAYDDAWIRPDDTNMFTSRMYQAYRHADRTNVDYQNLLIRMASLAADKDLTDYFEHWGLSASDDTKAWLKAQKLEPETKPIYYLNETARRKRIEHQADMAEDTVLSAELTHDTAHGNDDKRAVLHMSVNKDQDKILGYEIIRNGKVIAFTNDDTYTDTITTTNNRVFTYEVIAYDYNLNPTNKVTLDQVKISHDGSIVKNNWEISSNVADDQIMEGDEQDNNTLKTLIDQDYSSVYHGETNKNIEFILNMNASQQVVGFKYTGVENAKDNLKNYEIALSDDGKEWTTVALGSLQASPITQTVFFSSDKDYTSNKLEIFDARYVKIIAKQKTLSAAEIDILAPPGDNVDLTDSGIGILKEAYTYAPGKSIPKGSLLFTGEYRGNPAFNSVLVIDENNKVVAGTGENGNADAILLAKIPENAPLNEIAKGTWIYWIEPENLPQQLPEKVKVELYRVDDALNSEGQRLVSDTLYVTLPKKLPSITLNNQAYGE